MWSVIIPAYNESGRIGTTLDSVDAYFRERGIDVEIIVVDDGSTDDTVQIAQKHERITVISGGVNHGKGWAVREGMKRAGGEIVLFTDADLATPIEEVERLFNALKNGSDIAVGSRMAKPRLIEKYQPWYRVLLGQAFGFIVWMFFSIGVKDTQCGFKMFTSKAAKMLAERMTVDGYTFDVEMLFLAKRMGLKVAELPVIWRDKPGSKLKVWKDFPYIMKELAAMRRSLK